MVDKEIKQSESYSLFLPDRNKEPNENLERCIEDDFSIALTFFRQHKDKAFHMTYQNRIRMSALSYHVKYGSYQSMPLPETGLLDVIGRDIRRQLQSLECVSHEKAMEEFIHSLRTACPEFNGFLEAKIKEAQYEAHLKKETEEQRRQQLINQKKKEEQEKIMAQALELENEKRVEQENKLRTLLNRQTLPQFQEYASQQHPTDIKAQERLIVQLQHHHFHQYMLAIYERSDTQHADSSQHFQSNNTFSDDDLSGEKSDLVSEQCCESSDNNVHDDLFMINGGGEKTEYMFDGENKDSVVYCQDMVEMWCQASIDEFKAGFKNEPDSVMKIGSGEVLTIQIKVPGGTGGDYLIWQFATDEHDIGFGLFVANLIDGEVSSETGKELVPILRRDSHKQVYCGRLRLHKNVKSEKMCFLLRFDNSYSLWRFKWLYYRVCYSD